MFCSAGLLFYYLLSLISTKDEQRLSGSDDLFKRVAE